MTDQVDFALADRTAAGLSRVLAGPPCTMVPGELGDDIIEIERLSSGDDTDSWGPPFFDGDAAPFFSVPRSKQSIALDLTARTTSTWPSSSSDPGRGVRIPGGRGYRDRTRRPGVRSPKSGAKPP